MEPSELCTAVIDAFWRPAVRTAVADLYTALETRISQRRPLCVLSGRCCRFDEYGHRLYVTTIELAAFLYDYLNRPLAEVRQAARNWDKAGCPFQVRRLCGVHPLRPMGCRLFFCDVSSEDWQHEQYEWFHSQLKRLHERLAVPYAYVEWRTALTQLGFK
jgi:Fe-S-cluster containining protein